MRVLAIETATAQCSVALLDNGLSIACDSACVGRGHAERLLPMIAALPDGGRADAIWVDCGPGSFTGVRVGIAAARALGLGWNIPVLGYSSVSLVAATWLSTRPGGRLTVALEAGHGEVLVQSFDGDASRPTDDCTALGPQAAAARCFTNVVGNAAGRIASVRKDVVAHDLQLLAENAGRLPGATLPVVPIYSRGPDARPMQ